MPQVVEHESQARPAPTARPNRFRARGSCTCSYRSRPRHCRSIPPGRRPAAGDDGCTELVARPRRRPRHHRHLVESPRRSGSAGSWMHRSNTARGPQSVKRTSPRIDAPERRPQALNRRLLSAAVTASGRGRVGSGAACPACGGAFVGRRYLDHRHGSFNASARVISRIAPRPARLNSSPMPGRVRSGRSPVDGRERAIEQHVLDPDVVMEVLNVAYSLRRTRRVRVEHGAQCVDSGTAFASQRPSTTQTP